MKILESQPQRYDWGVSWLSLGQADRARRKIADELVRPGMRVLDIGCGTGTMAVLAAKKGATVWGFDVSEDMLHVAREKIERAGLSEKIELHEMGVSGMDRLSDQSFELVLSTLVFSELSGDEQTYALTHAHRVLKENGYLAIAGEIRPESGGKRIFYNLLRIPLLIVTFALTQTTTKPVGDLPTLVSQAGFRNNKVVRSSLGSFIYLVAQKVDRT
ncbi:MAG: methyltransferase domain-containing protein [Actinobacteria bacterium]|nr:methyltransferase domain-containing protein [Actinomycetota bacterium]